MNNPFSVEMLCVVAILSTIPAYIASGKGRRFWIWWLYGFAMFAVALPHSLLMDDPRIKKCPECAERIPSEARICSHCRHEVAE